MTKANLDIRYPIDHYTAPYVFEKENDMFVDSACLRGVGSLINHSIRPNARSDVVNGSIIIRATVPIHHNEQIFLNYNPNNGYRNYRINEPGLTTYTK